MRTKRLPLVLAIAAVLTACAPAPLLYPPPAPATPLAIPTSGDYVAGATWTDVKLPGVTVGLLDAGGKTLREYANATNENGAFALALPEALPARFRLVVTAGNDKLMADFENFNPDVDTAFVTPLTTLASKYLDSKPGTKPADAEAAVERYLGLDPTEHLGYETGPDAKGAFDLAALMAAARAEGGLEAFTAKLAAELGTDKTRSFDPPVTKAGTDIWKILGTSPSEVKTDLFKAGLSFAGGQAMGWALSRMGYKTPEEKGHEAVMNDIAKQKEMLEGIQRDVKNLGKQVETTGKEISDALTQAKYEEVATLADDYMGPINTAYNRLVWYCEAEQRSREELLALTADWRAYVIQTMPKMVDGLHLQMTPGGGRRGLIALWEEAVLKKSNAGKLAALVDNSFLIPVNEHFSYYYGQEIKGMLVYMEVGHLGGLESSDPTFASNLASFQSKLDAQLALRGYRVLGKTQNDEVLIDRVNKLMWTREIALVSYPEGQTRASATALDGRTGKFLRGPNMALDEQAFYNNASVTGHGQSSIGAAYFRRGWRTPTAQEYANWTTAAEVRTPFQRMNQSGFKVPSWTNKLITTTTVPNLGYTLYVLLDSGGSLNPTFGTAENIALLACRPLTDLDEAQP